MSYRVVDVVDSKEPVFLLVFADVDSKGTDVFTMLAESPLPVIYPLINKEANPCRAPLVLCRIAEVEYVFC